METAVGTEVGTEVGIEIGMEMGMARSVVENFSFSAQKSSTSTRFTDATRWQQLGKLAGAALVTEVMLTPKPALVDKRGSGAHNDLTLESMLRSAMVLEPFFVEMAGIAHGATPTYELREALADCGRIAEQAMLEATAGSNSHRGAIWCIGLLVAAASINDHNSTSDIFTSSSSKSAMSNYMESHMESFMKSSTNSSSSIEHIAALAAQIAVFPDRSASDHETHGLVMRRTYGSGGARVEAQMGFPHVVKIGIPHLRSRRLAGEPEAACQLNTLLAIMSSLDDTCLLYRGGLQALETARAGAREILLIGGTATAPGMARLFQLDKDLLQLGASPGGSADLLAATLFLDSIDYARNDYTKNVHI